jgi:putative transposase
LCRPPGARETGRRDFICFIVDAFSRMIVGWRVAANMKTDMVLDAPEMSRAARGGAPR